MRTETPTVEMSAEELGRLKADANAYEQGFEAGQLGHPLHTNPFRGIRLGGMWHDGWHDGQANDGQDEDEDLIHNGRFWA